MKQTINHPSVNSRWVALLALFFIQTAFISAVFAEEAEEKPKPTPTTVAVFELDKPLSDQPVSDDPLFGSIGGESLYVFLNRLKNAGKDDKVAAVVLLLNTESVPIAHVEEIHQVLKEIKASKPVYVHADSVRTGAFLLASGGSRVSLSPVGTAWVTGLYGEQIYLKGLLDLLGVEPNFLTCGAYKSAGEMFTHEAPTPESAEMMNWIFDGMFDLAIRLAAEGRGVEADQARSWIDEGLYSAESAQKAGLIDAVETRSQLMAHLKETHGSKIRLDRRYDKKKAPQVNLDNPFSAIQLWSRALSGQAKTAQTRKNTVAVVHIDGPILLGKPETSLFGSTEGAYSEALRKDLDKIAEDEKIGAVVLRVNSPGGSATASEIILQAARGVQAKKPVVVSMGRVAASGGYYVSCVDGRIYADESTLTGSIGVVSGKLATEKMWKRVGIHFSPIQRGKNASLFEGSQKLTEEQTALLQASMDDVYESFKSRVSEVRAEKLTKPLEDLAGGRVYTGKQAKEIGLVDEIGTLNDAITYAAEQAELESFEVKSYPEQKNFLEQLFADISDKDKSGERNLSSGMWSLAEPYVQGLDPLRVSMVREAILQLDHFKRERVMLTMPVMRIID